MSVIVWLLRLLVLLVFIGLAVQNLSPTAIQIIPGLVWHISLIVLLLIFFIMGAILGMIAIYGRYFQSRQKYLKLKKFVDENGITRQ